MRSATQSCAAFSRPAGVLSRSAMYFATDSMLRSASGGIETTAGCSVVGSGHAVDGAEGVAPPGRGSGELDAVGAGTGAGPSDAVDDGDGTGVGPSPSRANVSSWTAL